MKQMKADIVVSGGGIAGLSLGILLAGAGLDVHLIDAAPPAPVKKDPKVDISGRTVALMENSLNIIRAAGVWDDVAEHAAPLAVMRIVDESGAEAEFHAEDIGLKQFGFNIPNAPLRDALYETAKNTKNLTLHMPDALEAYEAGRNVSARLKSGKEITATLIIGADGRNSMVRRISGIEWNEHDDGQSAITCLIAHSRAHNNTATEFHRPGGPVALVPMPGNISSVVWIEPTERAGEFMRLKKYEFTQALQERTRDILGAIQLESNPECWPLRTLKTKSLSAPRAVLMAEAAHVISPITAQGLNLSLRDVAALAETLVDAARAGLDIGAASVLEKYERRRMLDINTRVFGVGGMNRIVSTEMATLKGLRRAGLKTVDAIVPIKKIAMRIGLAPEIDSGRLTKGERL